MWISHILLRNNLTIVSRIFFSSHFLVGFFGVCQSAAPRIDGHILHPILQFRKNSSEHISYLSAFIRAHDHYNCIVFSPCHHFVRWCVFFIVVTCSVVPQRKRINSYNSKQVPHVKNIANQILGFVRETYAT